MYGIGVNRLGVPAGKSNPAGTPPALFGLADLFASSEEGGWYDPSDASTVFSDTSGTTAATLGDVVGRIADKSGNNLHLTAHADNMRPIWGREPTSGARNLLITSNDFVASTINSGTEGHQGWIRSQFNSGNTMVGVATSDTPPVGTGTVHKIGGTNASVVGFENPRGYFDSTAQTFSVYLKLTGDGTVDCRGILLTAGTGCQAYVRLDTETVTLTGSSTSNVASSSLTDVGNDWYRLVITTSNTTSSSSLAFYFLNSSNSYYSFGSSSPTILIYRPQLEKGTSATTAQETGAGGIHNATEEGYGHKHYLYFDGTDALGNQNSFASNEVSVVVSAEIEGEDKSAITSLGDGTTAGCGIWSNYDSTNKLSAFSQGVSAHITNALSYPYKQVFTLQSDTSDDYLSLNVDGGTIPDVISTASQPDGYAFLSNLSLGSSDFTGESNRFKGKVYQLIVRDTFSTTNEIAETENIAKTKAGL